MIKDVWSRSLPVVLAISCILAVLPSALFGQFHSFANLDAVLVNIWYEAENGALFCMPKSRQVSVLWEEIREDLAGRPSKMDVHSEFVARLDDLIELLPQICRRGDPIELSGHTYHLIWEFRMLRDFLGDDSYRLDLLWDIHDVHEEILLTVHDDKFGLLSWQEFIKMVEEMSALWEIYVRTEMGDRKASNPEITTHHELNVAKVSECLSYFFTSLESAFQADFQVPCDELGEALTQTIKSHASLEDLNE